MLIEQNRRLKIFSGTANPELARDIAKFLGTSLGDCEVKRFKDGEISVRIKETVRGAHVFIVQPTSNPADTNLMELLIMIDAMRRASAREVAAVVPTTDMPVRIERPASGSRDCQAGSQRHHRGADRVLTMDLHAGLLRALISPAITFERCPF